MFNTFDKPEVYLGLEPEVRSLDRFRLVKAQV